jgi:hypothetical protein
MRRRNERAAAGPRVGGIAEVSGSAPAAWNGSPTLSCIGEQQIRFVIAGIAPEVFGKDSTVAHAAFPSHYGTCERFHRKSIKQRGQRACILIRSLRRAQFRDAK